MCIFFKAWRVCSLSSIVEDKALKAVGKKQVSVKKYRKVLRLAALRLSPRVVGSAMASMRQRIQQIYKVNGSNPPRD